MSTTSCDKSISGKLYFCRLIYCLLLPFSSDNTLLGKSLKGRQITDTFCSCQSNCTTANVVLNPHLNIVLNPRELFCCKVRSHCLHCPQWNVLWIEEAQKSRCKTAIALGQKLGSLPCIVQHPFVQNSCLDKEVSCPFPSPHPFSPLCPFEVLTVFLHRECDVRRKPRPQMGPSQFRFASYKMFTTW